MLFLSSNEWHQNTEEQINQTYTLHMRAGSEQLQLFTKAMQIGNQKFKVSNAAILDTNSSKVTYITAKMFKWRIIECTEKNCINAEIFQIVQPLTNA